MLLFVTTRPFPSLFPPYHKALPCRRKGLRVKGLIGPIGLMRLGVETFSTRWSVIAVCVCARIVFVLEGGNIFDNSGISEVKPFRGHARNGKKETTSRHGGRLAGRKGVIWHPRFYGIDFESRRLYHCSESVVSIGFGVEAYRLEVAGIERTRHVVALSDYALAEEL